MKNLYKYIVIIILAIILAVAFTGSHNIQSVDDLAYAVAIGIDVGTNENLKITFQFTKPNSSGENASGETAPSVIDSVEASSFDTAMNLMNTFVSKEINLSHCKIIVFSEEFAKQGIDKELYTLMNKVQIRPDSNVIVSTSTAEEYIRSVSPTLENLVAKFYEILPRSSEYTGYTTDIELGDFFNKFICQTCEAVAISGTPLLSNSDSSQDGDAGKSSTLSAKNGIENIGLAIFKEDRFVGTLNTTETLCHLIVINELENCNLSIPDPENENKTIDLYLILDTPTKTKVSILNGTPYITIDVKVNTRVSSIDDLYEEVSQERIDKIERAAEDYLNQQISAYLYKTAKEFEADTTGVGKYALSSFKTSSEFKDYDWLDKYSDSFFQVNSTVSIKSGFLLTGT